MIIVVYDVLYFILNWKKIMVVLGFCDIFLLDILFGFDFLWLFVDCLVLYDMWYINF